MNAWRLIRRSLRFHWRTHLGVVAGAAVATAVLVGAMVVGDSVRHSLRALALSRLGDVHVSMGPGDRYFRARLAAELAEELSAPSAAAIQLRGVAVGQAGRRANGVHVLGVDDAFWALRGGEAPPPQLDAEQVVVNRRLADQLGVGAGDSVLLRVPRPSLLPRDAPLSDDKDTSTAFRLTVAAVAGDGQFGRFGLRADQVAPYNAFVPLAWLQERVRLPGKANLLLVGPGPGGVMPVETADAAVRRRWRLADAALELRELPRRRAIELRSDRIFLASAVVEAAAGAGPAPVGVLTYFVNEIRSGGRTTPYSTVAAMGPLATGSPATAAAPARARINPVPAATGEEEVLIGRWLAEDLDAAAGDRVALTYFVLGRGRTLTERTRTLRVGSVLSSGTITVDPTLMPAFPGVTAAENCSDWKPGIPIDFKRIRPADERYWDDFRGAPKAFVSLPAGRAMWGNRFGDLTSVRWPAPPATRRSLTANLRRRLSPASAGLFFRPVRRQGLAAGTESLDFGQLFLYLSFFLIAAALLLMGLLLALGIERRSEEVGTLLAVGLPRATVRRLLLGEGLCLALAGVAVGAPAGLLYTRAVLQGLGTVWGGAVAGAHIRFHVAPLTLTLAAAGALLAAMAAMWLVLRRQGRAPARQLLAEGAQFQSIAPRGRLARSRAGLAVGVITALAAGAVLLVWGRGERAAQVSAFFAAGGLLLAAVVGFAQALLAAAGRRARLSLPGLGLRNAARRPGRSLATITLLACGVFLIVAIGAFRRHAGEGAGERSSGTGGFALLGETAMPILHDLNAPAGREAFRLPEGTLRGASVVGLRVRAGDDASCLNLNRAQRPRLLGVDPEALDSRGAFTLVKAADGRDVAEGWDLLSSPVGEEVPAVGDNATVTWALGKSVGDAIEIADERGRRRRLRIVGVIADSVLQGSLVISESNFERLFPSESGYRMLLIDAPPAAVDRVRRGLARAGQDVGLQLTPAARRLAEFNVIQNTYLSIFQALGGLGLILGSVGLGVVLMRNVLDRRGELALMRAVGFRRPALVALLLAEHWGLLALGLLGGAGAGLLAVVPALQSPGTHAAHLSVGLTLLGVLVSGAAWTVAAAATAVRAPLLAALRTE